MAEGGRKWELADGRIVEGMKKEGRWRRKESLRDQEVLGGGGGPAISCGNTQVGLYRMVTEGMDPVRAPPVFDTSPPVLGPPNSPVAPPSTPP